MRRLLAAGLMLVSLPLITLAQQQTSAEIQTLKVQGNLYLLTGAGATVFVMAPECQRLTGVDPFAPEFVAAHADLVQRDADSTL